MYEKLVREYKSKDWNRDELHPGLEGVKESPLYKEFLKKREEEDSWGKFLAMHEAPSPLPTFRVTDYMGESAEFESLPNV